MIRDVMVMDGSGGGAGASTKASVFVPLTNVPARASRYPLAFALKFMPAIVNESNRYSPLLFVRTDCPVLGPSIAVTLALARRCPPVFETVPVSEAMVGAGVGVGVGVGAGVGAGAGVGLGDVEGESDPHVVTAKVDRARTPASVSERMIGTMYLTG